MLIDWFTIIAQLINFLVLVWLLKRFLYRPILNAVDAREKIIAQKLANAEKIQVDARNEREKLHRKIIEIDNQKSELIDKATSDAEAERQRLFEKARKAVDVFKEKAHENFKSEEKQIHHIIIKEMRQEVFSICRRVLMDLANVSLESQIINSFIQRLNELEEETKNMIKSSPSTSTNIQGVVRTTFVLTSNQQNMIEEEIHKTFNLKTQLQFENVPELLSGIEFIMNGQKLAWSINDYLVSMEKEVHQLLSPQVRSQ